MPRFSTSAEWLSQSSLLLKARPTSTRISSKYSVLSPKASKVSKSRKKAATLTASEPAAAPASDDVSATPTPTRANIATFTLKTYDPASGTCLKYQTNKAAEVGRLVGSLGKLARVMAALPEVVEDLSAPIDQAGTHTPVPEGVGKDVKAGDAKGPPGGGGAGGGKKKKKGKK
ncbi:uncharacterized protein BDZ99DRAFT_444994 [Mytilinidion resinicola]|uniref:SRP9 domain-containing protein n=1 Tax=Mytilinidion resinicola TaxID=574789 RepID=A0A6A6YKG4_9PEZI|nr:uncharacterized protein BDZ99DRAFT_444994 [Mytilinidion resinicola]KAF2809039.1 hypothetical protein BDZ99DRAFT_444994 [Mytilinidion resinicola]